MKLQKLLLKKSEIFYAILYGERFMTNFDIFTATPQFESFVSVAISAERILHIDPSACVLNCRRAMEFAVKWMYSVDKALVMPYQNLNEAAEAASEKK